MLRCTALLLAGLWVGCGSSERTRTTDRDPDTVEREDLEGRDLRRVEDMLRGQVAGVEVRQTPAGLVIRIRGSATNGFGLTTSDPLFVIDGLPIQFGAGGALDGLNPRDIASIRVLKNVSETALYGSRGANGVILITTIRPAAAAADTTDS